MNTCWFSLPIILTLYNWINKIPWRNLLLPSLQSLQYSLSLQTSVVLPQKILNQAFPTHTYWSLARKFKFPLYQPSHSHNLLFSIWIKIKDKTQPHSSLSFSQRHTFSSSSGPTPHDLRSRSAHGNSSSPRPQRLIQARGCEKLFLTFIWKCREPKIAKNLEKEQN